MGACVGEKGASVASFAEFAEFAEFADSLFAGLDRRGQAVCFAINCLLAVTTQGVACVEVAGGLLRRRLKARGAERTKLRGVAQ